MEILYILIGIIIGGTLAWAVFRNKGTAKLASIEQRANMLSQENTSLKSELEEKTGEIIKLNTSLASKETELQNIGERIKEQKEELTQLREKFNLEFKNLANEILEEKTKKFTEQNKNNLGEILNPLNEKLKEFEKKVEETYDKEAQQRFSLKEEVKRLAELNQQVSKEANSLTQALKGESKTQGNWGEVILESILEKTGLRKDEEYFVQESYTSDDGKRLQPDVIVHYPGERSIVIDSKVSLTAYERYTAANEDAGKESELKAHIISVKKHIDELSSKNYSDLKQIKTLDFVVMFMPIEPSYLVAIQADPTLWSYAYEKRVLLISPTNIVAILKMVESLWKQEYQSKNVMKIAEQGGKLYDEFVLLANELLNLGKKIKEADKLYEDSMKRISEGRGNLVKRVTDLKELGVKHKRQLPDKLVERALDKSGE